MVFKVGDRVVITKEYQSDGLVGLRAKIVTTADGGDGVYGLQVDSWSGHTLNGLVQGGGWLVPAHCLKKLATFKGNK